jgi:hypothetical protein
MRDHRPIYPSDGAEYTRALQEAKQEYKDWLESRKDKVGLDLLAVRKFKKENAHADIRSEGGEGRPPDK